MSLPAAGSKRDHAVGKPGQGAFPAALVLDRLPQHELGFLPGKSLEVLWFVAACARIPAN